jgi:hypothetical protein
VPAWVYVLVETPAGNSIWQLYFLVGLIRTFASIWPLKQKTAR